MTRRYWFVSDGAGKFWLTNCDGGPHGVVTVRGKEADIPYDGVWVDGEPSPDTYVIIDGFVTYYAPEHRFSRWSFDKHKVRGGGHALP